MNVILNKEQIIFCNKRIDWVKENRQDLLFTVVFLFILVVTGLLEGC